MGVTGHRSTAVRSYKRVSGDQRSELSDLLHGKRKCDDAPSKTMPDQSVKNTERDERSASDVIVSTSANPAHNINITVNVFGDGAHVHVNK